MSETSSTVTLPPAERQSFTLRNVACSYTGTHSPIHKATIDYFNLGTIPDGNWPLRLQVTSKSSNKKKAPLSIDILRCNAPDSTCWITTRALDEANMSVSTDLELTVTNTSDEALKPPPFTLSFVESPRGPGNGAVTSADNIRKIGTKKPHRLEHGTRFIRIGAGLEARAWLRRNHTGKKEYHIPGEQHHHPI